MNKTPELLVIASYPPKGEKHSSAIVGGAMYAKNTLQAVIKAAGEKQQETRITVLAEAFHRKKESYEEDGIQVKRFWKRNSITTYISLLKEIAVQHKSTESVIIEFEFAMFGDRLSLLPLPLFLLTLKLMGKRTVFVFHQVVDNIGDMGGHLNLKETGIKTSILNHILRTLYASLMIFSDEVIVFEEILKKRLGRLGNARKITVIPFGTETFSPIPSQTEARKKLGLPENAFVIFTFGFIAWYKGSDWLVEQFSRLNAGRKLKIEDREILPSNIRLILGGGGNPNHMNKPYYVDYVQKVTTLAIAAGVTVTGFIPEDDLPLYFAASDIILLPYRTMMSSSGPLSLAFSFKKPFLLSKPLAPFFQTEDVRAALSASQLTSDDVTFALDNTFVDKLQTLRGNEKKMQQIKNLSERIGKERNWKDIGEKYFEVFFKELSSRT
jgi:glycosyltransferase involved in cell wall biosynthesis